MQQSSLIFSVFLQDRKAVYLLFIHFNVNKFKEKILTASHPEKKIICLCVPPLSTYYIKQLAMKKKIKKNHFTQS